MLLGTSPGGPTYTGVVPIPKHAGYRKGLRFVQVQTMFRLPRLEPWRVQCLLWGQLQNFPHSGTELAA